MFTRRVLFRCVTVDFLPLLIFKVLFPAHIKYQSHHTVISLKRLHFRAVFLISPWVIFKSTYMATTYTHEDMRRKKESSATWFLGRLLSNIRRKKKWVWLVSPSCCCMFASIKVYIWHSNHTHWHMHTRLTQCVKTEDFFLNCVTNILFQHWLHSIKQHSAYSSGHTCMGLYRLQTFAPLTTTTTTKKKVQRCNSHSRCRRNTLYLV